MNTKIASLYAEVTVKGVRVAEGAVKTFSRSFAEMGKAVKGIVSSVASVTASLGSNLVRVGSMASNAIMSLARSAMQGTVEGERLSMSMEYLTRSIGQGFAPYVRAATLSVVGLASAFNKLDPAMKTNITRWALLAAGVGAVIAAMPIIVAVITAVISPIGLLTAGIVALGVAFVASKSQGQDFAGTMGSVAQSIIDSFFDVEQFFRQLFATGKFVFENLGSVVRGVFQNVVDWIKYALNNAMELVQKTAHNTGKLLENIGKGNFNNLRKGFQYMDKSFEPKYKLLDQNGLRQQLADIDKDVDSRRRKWKGFGGEIAKGIREITGPGSKGFQMKVAVGFESLQGTFERLQKAMASDPSLSIEQKQLDEQKKTTQGIYKIAEVIGKLGGQSPVGE